jgi:hypothetical protein
MATTEPEYLENFGRPEWVGPVSLFKYNDPNETLVVYLTVIRATPRLSYTPTSHDQHWMFTWYIGRNSEGQDVVRVAQIVQEIGRDHLTNWGAITVIERADIITNGVKLPLAQMTLAQRQAFETISNGMRVRRPDGEWNCQDWCKSVLKSSVENGLVTQEEVDRVLLEAESVEPKSCATT